VRQQRLEHGDEAGHAVVDAAVLVDEDAGQVEEAAVLVRRVQAHHLRHQRLEQRRRLLADEAQREAQAPAAALHHAPVHLHVPTAK